jgi:hypothetical protein
MKIHLHIERVILDGFPVRETRGVLGALRQELARLLVEGGLSHQLSQGGVVPFVRGGEIIGGKNSHPERLGTRVARAVYTGIGVRK